MAVLREEIGKILGLDKKYNVIILGAGNLGQALANYGGFSKRGFIVSGIFDVNPDKIGQKIGTVQVRHMSELQNFFENNKVDIAALTLPKAKAPEVANELVALGVCAFWNFAATDLNLSAHVVVENVHLAESLMRLSYNIANLDKK